MGQTSTRTYDAAGQLLSIKDFNGQTTTYAYDAAGRLTSTVLPGGETIGRTYTATGKLATLTDAHGVTTISYDLRDRPIDVRNPDGTPR